jgi:hypothetical protein
MSALEFGELVRRFAAVTLPKSEWTHRAHLSVGAWYVYTHGEKTALELLRSGIRRLNASHGVENSATGGYHETITAAYVRLLGAFLAARSRSTPLETRVEELLGSPLAAREALLRFWSRELLFSVGARAEWVEPDLAPLELDLLFGSEP